MPPIEGEYEPNPMAWVRDQVEKYESTGGREGNTLMETGLPVVIVTTRGNKTGKVRKTPLMRVEHDGEYALVGFARRRAEAPGLVPQPQGRPDCCHDPGWPGAVRRHGPRTGGRRASHLVGPRGRRLSAVRRIPDAKPPA